MGSFPGFFALDEMSALDNQKLVMDNCASVLNALAVTLPVMASAGGGDILLFGSHACGLGHPFMAGFSAAKAFIHDLALSSTSEWAPRGVRVTALSLGTVDSVAERQLLPDRDPAEWITPEEIAEWVAWFRSRPVRLDSGAVVPLFRPSGTRYSAAYLDRIGRGDSKLTAPERKRLGVTGRPRDTGTSTDARVTGGTAFLTMIGFLWTLVIQRCIEGAYHFLVLTDGQGGSISLPQTLTAGSTWAHWVYFCGVAFTCVTFFHGGVRSLQFASSDRDETRASEFLFATAILMFEATIAWLAAASAESDRLYIPVAFVFLLFLLDAWWLDREYALRNLPDSSEIRLGSRGLTGKNTVSTWLELNRAVRNFSAYAAGIAFFAPHAQEFVLLFVGMVLVARSTADYMINLETYFGT